MLPLSELDRLTTTIADALNLAAAGKITDGFACLLAGLQHAQARREAGEAWGKALVRRYQRACHNDAARHSLGRA